MRHSHPFETAVFVISGRARAYFGLDDGEWVDLEAGDFLYISADLPQQEANRKPGNGGALSAVEPPTRVTEVPQELERTHPAKGSG